MVQSGPVMEEILAEGTGIVYSLFWSISFGWRFRRYVQLLVNEGQCLSGMMSAQHVDLFLQIFFISSMMSQQHAKTASRRGISSSNLAGIFWESKQNRAARYQFLVSVHLVRKQRLHSVCQPPLSVCERAEAQGEECKGRERWNSHSSHFSLGNN